MKENQFHTIFSILLLISSGSLAYANLDSASMLKTLKEGMHSSLMNHNAWYHNELQDQLEALNQLQSRQTKTLNLIQQELTVWTSSQKDVGGDFHPSMQPPSGSSQDDATSSITQTYPDLWSDDTDEDLETLEEDVNQERIMRFEASLTLTGRQELTNRTRANVDQFKKDVIRLFGEDAESTDFLTDDPATLTPRELKYRSRILDSMKQKALLEMHSQHLGLTP